MSGTLSLIQSKNDLLQTMNEAVQTKYYKLMQLWFQHKIDKSTFDKEITKLLNKTQNELHKRLILIFLHKYMKYSKNKYLNLDINDETFKEETIASIPGANNTELLGHIDKKMKVSHEREYQFEPVDVFTHLPTVNVDFDEESLLNANKNNYLMGLLQIISWQQGVHEGAPNNEIGALIQYSVNVFIKHLLTTIVTQKKTFRQKGGNFICDIGKPLPNPWLKSSHIYRTQQSTRYPLVKSKTYLSEKRSLLSNENFHSAINMSNAVQFNLLKRESSKSITLEDILYVVANNVNNVIPLQDLQYSMFENILPAHTPE